LWRWHGASTQDTQVRELAQLDTSRQIKIFAGDAGFMALASVPRERRTAIAVTASSGSL
jgi:hypothetical protein